MVGILCSKKKDAQYKKKIKTQSMVTTNHNTILKTLHLFFGWFFKNIYFEGLARTSKVVKTFYVVPPWLELFIIKKQQNFTLCFPKTRKLLHKLLHEVKAPHLANTLIIFTGRRASPNHAWQQNAKWEIQPKQHGKRVGDTNEETQNEREREGNKKIIQFTLTLSSTYVSM